MGILDGVKGKQLLKKGRAAQEKKQLEEAYALYKQAAELGNADAMVAIGIMYMSQGFRPVKASNMLHLLSQGMPIFPWDVQEKLVPDTTTALSWYRKAADKGNVDGLRLAGTMLCAGEYCPQDLDAGLQYLDKAVAKGDTPARWMRCLYSKPVRKDIPDPQYERWLAAFQKAADAGTVNMYELYEWLKSGSDAQLARLGYVLITARNNGKKGYEQFKHLYAGNGMPLIPVVSVRGNWQSCVLIDLNAFASQETYLAFSSDIDPEITLRCCHRLERCGTAVYESPAFGWLREEKHALLLRMAPDKRLDEETLQKVIADFFMPPEQYEPRSAAFFVEDGEKEYSVEIAAITGDKVDVLLRYTIGGSDHVHEYFLPRLVSVNPE